MDILATLVQVYEARHIPIDVGHDPQTAHGSGHPGRCSDCAECGVVIDEAQHALTRNAKHGASVS